MKIRITALLLSAMLLVSVFAGCTKTVVTSELAEAGTEGTYETIKGVASGTTSSKKDNNNNSSSGHKTTEEKDNDKNYTDNGNQASKPPSTHDDSKGELVVNVGKDPNADYTVTGKVTIAVNTRRVTDSEALFVALEKAYPKLDINYDYYYKDDVLTAEYIIAKMESGKNIPDIIWDDAGSLPTYLAQGFVYPLDSFVKNDPDFKYVPNNIIRDYTYCGKLYALPNGAHWEEFYIDKGVLNALNEKMPALDWTPENFADLANKAASDDRFGGMESMGMIHTLFTAGFNDKTTKYGYNLSTKRFDVDGYTKAVKYVINTKNRNKYIDLSTVSDKDYKARFGQRIGWTAFNNGKTLFHGVGTWELPDKREAWSKKNWINWTVPQAKGTGVMPVHVDHSFMMSTCKNPKAAFQVLRFLTYSTEGNLARLSMYDKANEGKYALRYDLFYPTTTHPDVAKKYYSLPNCGKTEKYLFDNFKNSVRFDLIKIVPDWSSIENTYLTGPTNTAVNGAIGNVDGTLTDMENKANTAVAKAWSSFEAKLKVHQQKFAATH